MEYALTILLNTACADLKSVEGSEFWVEDPLPYQPSDFCWYPNPLTSVGTFNKTKFVHRCGRVVICEGAVHDGTTYTTLGTQTVWMVAKTTPPVLDRPEWMRGERDTARWLQLFHPDMVLQGSGKFKARRWWPPDENPMGDCAWVQGGTISFTVPAQRLFNAMILPQVNGPTSTIAANSSLGAGTIYVSGSAATDNHNTNNYAQSPLLHIRIGTDPTIYQATSGTWDAGNSRWQFTVSPALQVAATATDAVTWVRGRAMPPGIPHDLLLVCRVYRWIKYERTSELVPDSDPPEYQWAGGSSVVAKANAGTRINPYLFYWRCEPREHYAAP